MPELDFILVNSGDSSAVYQGLNDLSSLEPPTFTALVAAYLISKGFMGEIVDVPTLTSSVEIVAEDIVRKNPHIVGVFVYGYQPSASTQNMPAARKICQAIKNINPDLSILISGTHPSALPEQTLKEEPVDLVCDREGFVAMEQLIQGKNPEDIPSLWFKKDNSILSSRMLGIKDELMNENELNNHVSMPAWKLLDMNKYRSHNWHAFGMPSRSPYASLYTSLGCPFKCSFCCINSVFGKPTYRLWNPDVIIKQIEELINVYGVRNIKFVDEMFVLDEEHVLGICDRIIERKLDLNIWAYARVDTVKEHFMERLRKAGFRWLALGIESSSKHVRDGANKRYTNDNIKEVVKKIKSSGIYVIGNYIFGLPDDTNETMQQTFDLAVDLNCEFANFYCAQAYPGSKLYGEAIKNGYVLPPTWSGYSQHSYETFPLSTKCLTNAEVLAFRDQSFNKYFSGQRYLDMIGNKFGPETVKSINHMLAHTLKRKLLDNKS